MRPSNALAQHRAEFHQVLSKYAGRLRNLRVFGSVLHGTDKDGSDLDLLVDALPDATLFDLGGLQDELETLLGIRVHLLTPQELPKKFRGEVLAEAKGLGTGTGQRNSITDPLQIATVPCGAGTIGMTICPGKKGPSIYGPPWNRDLGQDFAVVAAWEPAAMLTLMETFEFEEVGVPDFPEAASAQPWTWYHLPFVDGGVPGPDFEAAWQTIGPQLHQILAAGRRILIHCRGGLGRTGLVAARLLIEAGVTSETAIETVRAARPGAVETVDQEVYLHLNTFDETHHETPAP